MRGRPLLIVAVLAAACENSSKQLVVAPTEPATVTTGSVVGVVRGSGTGYPWGNGNPGERSRGWPLSAIAAIPEAPGQRQRWTGEDYETGSFRFANLPSGRWTIRFLGMNPWIGVFPGLHLYADSAIAVTVEPNRTTTIDIVPRPVAPFIMIAIDHCPWGFGSTPIWPDDWGSCDSGYWGAPVDVQVDINGVAGTATSDTHYSFSIPKSLWYRELDNAVPGDYEVSVTPAAGPIAWRIVPWQSANTRVRLDRGIAYALFSFWYITP